MSQGWRGLGTLIAAAVLLYLTTFLSIAGLTYLVKEIAEGVREILEARVDKTTTEHPLDWLLHFFRDYNSSPRGENWT